MAKNNSLYRLLNKDFQNYDMYNENISSYDKLMRMAETGQNVPTLEDMSSGNAYIRQSMDISKEGLQNPANQIDYYTKQLAQNNVKVQEPSFFQKFINSTPVKVGGKALQILTSPLNAIWSGIMGGVEQNVKSIDDILSSEDVGSAALNLLKAPLNMTSGMLKGAAGALFAPYSDKMAEQERSLVDVLQTAQNAKSAPVRFTGNFITKAQPVYWATRAITGSDEKAQLVSQTALDIVASIFLDPMNSVSGLGKASKAVMGGTDAIKGIDKAADTAKALNAVRKANGLEDLYNTINKVKKVESLDEIKSIANSLKSTSKGNKYIDDVANAILKADSVDNARKIYSEMLEAYDKALQPGADYLLKKMYSRTGAMPDYKGIYYKDKELISADTLRKLGDSNKTKLPTLAALTVLNPAGTLYGAGTPLKKLIGKSKVGESILDKFAGGSSSNLRKLAEENPELYLETLAAERLKKIRPNERIMKKEKAYQDVLEWSKKIDDNEANAITKAIETPIEEYSTYEVIGKKEMLNPEYLSQAAYYNKGQMNKFKKQADEIVKEFNEKIDKIRKLNPDDVRSKMELYELVEQRDMLEQNIKMLDEFDKLKSSQFSQMLEEYGVFSDDILNKMPKELLSDPVFYYDKTIDEVSEIVSKYTGLSAKEAVQKATELKAASDVYIKRLDEVIPGFSKYLSGVEDTTIAKEVGEKVHKLDIDDEFKKVNQDIKDKENALKAIKDKSDDVSKEQRLAISKELSDLRTRKNKLVEIMKTRASSSKSNSSIEDIIKKLSDNYNRDNLITKSTKNNIEILHKKLGQEYTEAQRKIIEGLDEKSAKEYYNQLLKQYYKRLKLNKEGFVISKETGKKVKTIDEIKRLSELTKRKPRINLNSTNTSEAARVIEKARLERIAYEERGLSKYKITKQLLSDDEYSKLADQIARVFGNEKQYSYLAEEGDNLIRDLKHLDEKELKLVKEAISNRRKNPTIIDISFKAGIADGAILDDTRRVFEQSAESKVASNVLDELAQNKWKNADDLLNEQDEDVLKSILFIQESELNTGLTSHGRSTDIDDLSKSDMIERIKQNNEILTEQRINSNATEKQIKALKNAVVNSYKRKNKFYNEIGAILGDTKSSKRLSTIDLTRKEVDKIFKLINLDNNLQQLKALNPISYKEIINSDLYKKIDWKLIKKGGKEEVLEAVEQITKKISDSLSDEALDKIADIKLNPVQKAFLRKELENDAKKLLGLGNKPNTTWAKMKAHEIFRYLNGKSKGKIWSDVTTMGEYIVLKKRTSYLVETARKGDKPDNIIKKLILGTKFNSSDMDKIITANVFNTPKGVLKLDVDLSPEELKNAVKNFTNNEYSNVTSNVSTTVTNKLSNAGLAGDNIVVNPKNISDAMPHETAHIAFNGSKGNGDKTANALSRNIKSMFSDIAESDSISKSKQLQEALKNAGVYASEEALKEGYISDYVYKLSKDKTVSKRDLNHEQFAELTRAITKNSDVKNFLDSETIGLWERTIQKMKPKEFVENIKTSAPVRKELEDKLTKIKEYLDVIDYSKTVKYKDFKDRVEELSKLFDDNQKLIESFEKNFKGKISVPKMKEFDDVVEKIIKEDNYAKLSDNAKEIAEAMKQGFKRIGIEEGIITNDDVEEMAKYFTHMLNPDLLKDTKHKKLLKELGFDLSDPYNIFKQNRKLKGSIEQINKYMFDKYGIDKFFETNALKVYLMRSLKHEDILYRQKVLDDTLNLFGHKVMRYSDMLKMDLDDLERLSKQLGFEPELADIPANYDRLHRYVKGGKRTTTPDGITNIPYDLSKLTDYERKAMYVNGYKKWIESNREKGYVFVTKNKEFVEKKVKTISDDAIQNAFDVKNKQREAARNAYDILNDTNKIDDNIEEILNATRNQIDNLDMSNQLIPINPKDITEQTLYELDKGDLYLIPKRALDEYDATIKASFKKDKDALLEVFDKFMNVWKSNALLSPGFHINNAIGNTFNSYLQVGKNILDPKTNWVAREILTGKSGEFAGYTYQEIIEQAKLHGLLDSIYTVDFEDADAFIKGKADKLVNTAEKSKGKPNILKKIAGEKYNYNPFSGDFIVYKANQKLGSTIEQQSRMVNFLTHIKEGKTFDEAADLTNHVLFDYSDLTSFEHDVMKRVVPFYTYIRKNIPLQIEKMAEKGHVYKNVTNFYKRMGEAFETEEERDSKPEDYNSRLPIGGGKYLNLSLPMFDVDKPTSLSDMFSMTNPLLKLVPEMLTETNTFTGGKIKNKEKHIIESLIPSSKGIRPPLNIKQLDVDLRQRQMLYDYLETLQNDYYNAKKHGIIKEDKDGNKSISDYPTYEELSPLEKLMMSKYETELYKKTYKGKSNSSKNKKVYLGDLSPLELLMLSDKERQALRKGKMYKRKN